MRPSWRRRRRARGRTGPCPGGARRRPPSSLCGWWGGGLPVGVGVCFKVEGRAVRWVSMVYCPRGSGAGRTRSPWNKKSAHGQPTRSSSGVGGGPFRLLSVFVQVCGLAFGGGRPRSIDRPRRCTFDGCCWMDPTVARERAHSAARAFLVCVALDRARRRTRAEQTHGPHTVVGSL